MGKISTDSNEYIGQRVPCFPLETLMLALNRTKVDFFSLDVEGVELHILEAIPHTKIDIKSWTIEYDKVGENELDRLMDANGYERVTKIGFTDIKISMYTLDIVYKKK
jgi:hypothetical protein